MKITAIPQLYRNLRRWREIIVVLQRYGLADWLSQYRRLPFRDALKDRGGVSLAEYSREQRVRMALMELGPTFIKLGQVLAARPDLVGPKLAEELKRLRGDVQPDPISQVEATLAKDLGTGFRDHFRTIDSVPLATASIGQVHRATLRDGRRVVLKVQRADIERTMYQDIEVLAGLAQLAEHVESFAAWGPREMVRQLSPMIQRELDFGRERQHLDHFAAMLARHAHDVVIPRPVDRLCTRRVLVMEELVGVPLESLFRSSRQSASGVNGQVTGGTGLSGSEIGGDDLSGSDPPGEGASGVDPGGNGRANRDETVSDNPEPALHGAEAGGGTMPPELGQRLGESIAGVYLTMLFDEGLFHADPHPGNLFLLKDGRLGILDFGMIGRIDENLRETIEEMLVAISQGDQNRLTRLIKRVGDTPPTLDDSALAIDAADFVATYGRQRLGQFDLTGALNELSEILHRHAIKLPNQSALLLKMLISLEGTLRELGAGFDSLAIVDTFARRSLFRRLSPTRRLRQARRIYLESEHFLETAPDEVLSLLQQARKGQLSVMLEHHRIRPTINRVVLGIMSSAVFLGSSLMLSFDVPPVLFPESWGLGIHRLSILGLIGVIGSTSVMLFMLVAITRTGHLTRDDED